MSGTSAPALGARPVHRPSDGQRWLTALCLAALLALTWALTETPSSAPAPGYDEIAHIGAAVGLIEHGTNDLNPEHPRGIKYLAGVALRQSPIWSQLNRENPGQRMNQWEFGRQVLFGSEVSAGRILGVARLPFRVIACVGLLLVFALARQLGGTKGALLAAALYSLSPTVHAHASMVLTDLSLGVSVLAFLGSLVFTFQLATARARSIGCFVAGCLAALACGTKFSAPLLLAPVLLVFVAWPAADYARWLRLRDMATLGTAGLLLGLFAVNGFSLDPQEFVIGVRAVGDNHLADYQAYLLGEFREGGFALYFPATLLFKSTLVELAVTALVLVAVVRFRGAPPGSSSSTRMLITAVSLACIWYLVALALMAPNVAHRYVVPVHVLLFPLAALAFAGTSPFLGRALGTIMMSGALLTAWIARTDPYGFFNGINGCAGPRAIACLDESNVDWGQHIHRIWPALSQRLGANDVLVVDYFGGSPPEYYLPRYLPMSAEDWRAPVRAVYVISVHHWLRAWSGTASREGNPLLGGADFRCTIGPYLVIDLRSGANPGPCPLEPSRD